MHTIHLPDNIANLVEKVAEASKASHEEVLLEWVTHPVEFPREDNYERLLENLATLSTIHLWTYVYRQMPADEARYQVLYNKHESGGLLSSDEEKEWQDLADLSLIFSTIRLKALLLLKERGEKVEQLLLGNKLIIQHLTPIP